MADLVLTCTGREVDDTLTAIGEPCGTTYPRPALGTMQVAGIPLDRPLLGFGAPVDDCQYIAEARAAGWSVADLPSGLAVTCPACRKPPGVAVALARQVERRHTAAEAVLSTSTTNQEKR